MSEISVQLEQQAIGLTPETMAKAFWVMEDNQQAKFFDELAKVIEADHAKNPNAYGHGEIQWCYLKDRLRQPGMERANRMHMALSAFAFDFWTQKANGAREGL